MKVGDKVRHKTKKNVIGIVADFGKYDSVLVNLSNKMGVMFRKFRRSDLEVIE